MLLWLLRADPQVQDLVLCAWGGELDPKTCKVSTKACLNGADDNILVAIEEARTGVFQPNRENDELTRALGNPEHPGRTRGKGAIPWYEGFSDWNTDYRTHARKKIAEEREGRGGARKTRERGGGVCDGHGKIKAAAAAGELSLLVIVFERDWSGDWTSTP